MKDNNDSNKVTKLYPVSTEEVALDGLYLNHNLQGLGTSSQPFVYTNFISSLDGRIALVDSENKTIVAPKEITNSRDWRLFQELAAQADILMTSGRYIRQVSQGKAQGQLPVSPKSEFADLLEWRKSEGLTPQPAVVILSGSLDLPMPESLLNSEREIYVATGAESDENKINELKSKGVNVILAGDSMYVEGRKLIKELGDRGYTTINMIGGPVILQTLMEANVLNRLYMTHSLKILGGVPFDTLSKGKSHDPPVNFKLRSLYYDSMPEQLFAVYDAKNE